MRRHQRQEGFGHGLTRTSINFSWFVKNLEIYLDSGIVFSFLLYLWSHYAWKTLISPVFWCRVCDVVPLECTTLKSRSNHFHSGSHDRWSNALASLLRQRNRKSKINVLRVLCGVPETNFQSQNEDLRNYLLHYLGHISLLRCWFC